MTDAKAIWTGFRRRMGEIYVFLMVATPVKRGLALEAVFHIAQPM